LTEKKLKGHQSVTGKAGNHLVRATTKENPMTVNRANEVARRIVVSFTPSGYIGPYFGKYFPHFYEPLVQSIASAIQSEVDAAVTAERERCAKIADEFDDYSEIHDHKQSALTKVEIAKAIRLSKLEKESK
jgi:hypothetical protein